MNLSRLFWVFAVWNTNFAFLKRGRGSSTEKGQKSFPKYAVWKNTQCYQVSFPRIYEVINFAELYSFILSNFDLTARSCFFMVTLMFEIWNWSYILLKFMESVVCPLNNLHFWSQFLSPISSFAVNNEFFNRDGKDVR